MQWLDALRGFAILTNEEADRHEHCVVVAYGDIVVLECCRRRAGSWVSRVYLFALSNLRNLLCLIRKSTIRIGTIYTNNKKKTRAALE